MFRVSSCVIPTVFLVLLISAQAKAQPAGGGDVEARVSGLGGATFGSDSLTPIVAGSIGFHFSRRIGLELDFGYIHSLESDTNDIPRILLPSDLPPLFTFLPVGDIPSDLIFPPINLRTDARIIALTGNVVVDLPTDRRLRPYALVGVGVASVSRAFEFESPALGLPGLTIPRGRFERRSENALALSAGGGIDVRVRDGFAVGADVRYLFVPTDVEDFNLARVGLRASYRF